MVALREPQRNRSHEKSTYDCMFWKYDEVVEFVQSNRLDVDATFVQGLIYAAILASADHTAL